MAAYGTKVVVKCLWPSGKTYKLLLMLGMLGIRVRVELLPAEDKYLITTQGDE